MRKLTSMFIISIVILGFSTFALADINPHHEAYRCRINYTPDCDLICKQCHIPPYGRSPYLKVDVYSETDKPLCQPCHNEKGDVANPGYLLPGHGGDHPTGMYYAPSRRPDTRLAPNPVGPKLFCDPHHDGRCKVMCSTCHDPMANTKFLHRKNNAGSALCFSCHQK